MAAKTYYYQKTLSVTDTEQMFSLPRLRKFTILVTGDEDVVGEFDNAIDGESTTLLRGVPYSFGSGLRELYYKTASGTSSIQLIGEKHFKDTV